MKRLSLLIMFVVLAVAMQAQQKAISYIKDDGAWYLVYDESGKKINTFSKSSVGEVAGWGIDFFVSRDGNWVKVYDVSGKKLCTLSRMSVGEVLAVSSTTFTSQSGNWIYTFDKTGKKINTRAK